MSKRAVIAFCVLAFIAGRVTADFPPTGNDRPILSALAKLAKAALWIAAFAEPAPESPDHEPQHVMVDERGYAQINHSQGW